MLRPYQEKAISELRRAFSSNRKALLHLATGSGKGTIIAEIVNSATAKSNKVLIIVRRRLLVTNLTDRLEVEHSITMAGYDELKENALCEVASIDTLLARKVRPEAKLIIIDEAHDAVSNGYREFLSYYDKALILGVTATPYCKESLRHVADTVVHPITTKQLIDHGYLSPAIYYAPSLPNLRGVTCSGGDYAAEALEERMNVITGDIIDHWKRLGANRATIAFAVNISHSKSIVDAFLRVGISAEHIDADSSLEARDAAIQRLKEGKTKIISNVGILCTGVDIPFLSCIISARPTKSLILHVQQLGRGTRIYPGKENFIVLDHAGNCLRHGLITDEHEVNLDGKPKKEKMPQYKICKKCYAVYTGIRCHACGETNITEQERKIDLDNATLQLLGETPEHIKIAMYVKKMKQLIKEKKWKRGVLWHRVKEKYGEEVANKIYKKREIPEWVRRRIT